MTAEKSGEFRGKSVEAATNAGLAALRLSLEEVTVEIVRPGSRGVLGIGAEDAVVRVTAIGAVKATPAPSAQPEVEPAAAGRPTPAPAARTEPRPAPKAAPKPAEPTAAAVSVNLDKVNEKDLAAAQTGRELLLGLLERMSLRAHVEIVQQSDAEADEDDERSLVLNIVGDDLGMLIGRQNETLSALEFITRLMTNQQTHTRTGFVVDVNGHRAKRAASLRKLALRMADQTVQTGRTVAMEPMPPAERRIVHLALRDHPSVTTQSVGEGDRRKVTIIPKKS
ncbi:MAG: KH domain-containing protein [Chloroflexi bacterium]|nr:KH domain-containing protein [Chloroflexota bacterium]